MLSSNRVRVVLSVAVLLLFYVVLFRAPGEERAADDLLIAPEDTQGLVRQAQDHLAAGRDNQRAGAGLAKRRRDIDCSALDTADRQPWHYLQDNRRRPNLGMCARLACRRLK